MFKIQYKTNNIHLVERLNTILTFEVSIPILYLLTYLAGPIFFLIVAAAFLFAPYMIYVLIKEKKTGWVITFLIVVMVPLFVSLTGGITNAIYTAAAFISIAMFYLYCFVLKFVVKDWIKDYYSTRELNRQLLEKAKKEKLSGTN